MGTFRQKVQATTSWATPDPEDLAEAPKSSIFQRRRKTTDAAPAPANRRRKAPQPPVTAHRLFPAFAAIWFAALFGLGGLAISGEVLGALVVKLGLPALVPAAAPPLGFTAHALVAFALTVVGGLLGLVLGLRLRSGSEASAVVVAAPPPVAEPEAASAPAIADPYKVRARDAHPDAPPRRPLVLTEAFADSPSDTGAEALAEPETPLLRRKPFADLPKAAAADAAPWIPEFTPGGSGAIQPLDLAVLDLAEQFEDADGDVPEAEAEPQELASESQPETYLEAAPEAAVLPLPAAPTLIAATPQLPTGFAAKLPELPNGGWSPVAAAPLENLGLVQLIERLALAMAARNAPNDADAESGADAGVPETDALAAPEYVPGPFSGPQPTASPASAPQQGSARDMLLRRLGAMAAGDTPADDKADHSLVSDGAPPFSRPAARLPSEAPAETVATLRSDQVAASAAPQVTAAADASVPFETDEALRSALATLQRMTARA